MDHIAIDLGSKESQICVRSGDGTILEERRYATGRLPTYLRKRAPARVIVETSAEAFFVADAALALGHQVRVVPCSRVRSLGVGNRGLKTDRRDAQVLSEASCRIDLPSVHIPSETSRRRKTLCGMRECLVDSRTKLINSVKGWCRTQGHRVRSGGTETVTTRIRESFAAIGELLPEHVERQLAAIDGLAAQIASADRQLEQEALSDPLCQRLMTVPGVGPVTAVRFAAALDDISRFRTAHDVQSYLGLVPGEHSSALRVRRTSITKAGPRKLRWALVQASWSARRTRKNDPMVLWCIGIEKRRGRRVALLALARKLAGILFAMWRDGTTYSATPTAS